MQGELESIDSDYYKLLMQYRTESLLMCVSNKEALSEYIIKNSKILN